MYGIIGIVTHTVVTIGPNYRHIGHVVNIISTGEAFTVVEAVVIVTGSNFLTEVGRRILHLLVVTTRLTLHYREVLRGDGIHSPTALQRVEEDLG